MPRQATKTQPGFVMPWVLSVCWVVSRQESNLGVEAVARHMGRRKPSMFERLPHQQQCVPDPRVNRQRVASTPWVAESVSSLLHWTGLPLSQVLIPGGRSRRWTKSLANPRRWITAWCKVLVQTSLGTTLLYSAMKIHMALAVSVAPLSFCRNCAEWWICLASDSFEKYRLAQLSMCAEGRRESVRRMSIGGEAYYCRDNAL